MPTVDPIARFLDALARARSVERTDVTAMTLATADARGRPSARMVLLKGADARGFTFFTNRESRKGDELARNPHAALCIYWPVLGEQVRVEGAVERVADEESDAYFATRPRGSQLGAWVSAQSAALGSYEELGVRLGEVEARFPGGVPRPPYWGGYRVVPEQVEFWFARESRLHERILYRRDGAGWRASRVSP